jgi:hypothetical protein
MYQENGPFKAPFNGDTCLEKEFLKLRDNYGVTSVVETGTHHGVTTHWLGKNFNRVYSIETKRENFRIARKSIKNLKNVKLFNADSSVSLGHVLDQIDRVFIVFLDAHWFNNPVLKELEAIRDSFKFPILVIHDFQVPDRPEFGYDKYPEQGIVYEWDWVKDKVNEIYGVGNYSYYYNRDAEGAKRGCLFVIPKLEMLKSNFRVNKFERLLARLKGEALPTQDTWIDKLKYIKPEKTYSQFGEESYLNSIMEKIGVTNKYFVDFGAGDGVKFSNTRLLKEKFGWSGLMMDGDNHGKDEVKKEFITAENICGLFEKYNVPVEFDLLSIDIDGNDFWVLKELLKKYRPRLIIAEFNGTIGRKESKVMMYNPSHTWNNDNYYGFSFKAGKKLAEETGYRIIFQNKDLNLYMVRREILNSREANVKVNYNPRQYHKHAPGKKWVKY